MILRETPLKVYSNLKEFLLLLLNLPKGLDSTSVVNILKTQQRFSIFGTCFDVSNIIISHNEYIRFTE